MRKQPNSNKWMFPGISGSSNWGYTMLMFHGIQDMHTHLPTRRFFTGADDGAQKFLAATNDFKGGEEMDRFFDRLQVCLVSWHVRISLSTS